MSYTNGLDKPSDYFNTKLYVGDGTTSNAITGVGFQPDWVWTKNRTNARGHGLFDSVRGADKWLQSNNNLAEQLEGEGYGVLSFDTDGFTVGNGTGTNESGSNMVAWNWLASNTTASNTDGSITSTVSANTTSGFSIVSYTGTGANATIGHGLGVAPKMIITKARGTTNNWGTYHESLGNTDAVFLNLTNATDTASTYWNNTSPTSSVFSVGSAAGTNPSATMIAYCFAEKKGFSKFGSYTGNGSTDGTFVYTGMSPSFVLLKETSNANNWMLFDNKRSSFNLRDDFISPDIADAEYTGNANNRLDMLSNGFKIRGTGSATNRSGSNFIYMAFAESPFTTSTGIPTTAR